MDELVKEYLLFRGFTGTLKALDADLKSDKDKAFRVSISSTPLSIKIDFLNVNIISMLR